MARPDAGRAPAVGRAPAPVDTIAESPGGSPSPARNRLASATSCAWIGGDADLLDHRQRRRGADPVEPAGETSNRRASLGQPHRQPVVGGVQVLAGVPARRQRPEPLRQPRRDSHEGRAARRHQPLVRRGRPARRPAWRPPAASRPPGRVERPSSPRRGRRGDDRGQRRPPRRSPTAPAVRDHRGALVDRVEQPVRSGRSPPRRRGARAPATGTGSR